MCSGPSLFASMSCASHIGILDVAFLKTEYGTNWKCWSIFMKFADSTIREVFGSY